MILRYSLNKSIPEPTLNIQYLIKYIEGMIDNNIKLLFDCLQKPNNFLLINKILNLLFIIFFKIIWIVLHALPHFLIVLVLCGQYLEVVIPFLILLNIIILLFHQWSVNIIEVVSQSFLFYDFVKVWEVNHDLIPLFPSKPIAHQIRMHFVNENESFLVTHLKAAN